MFLCVWEMMNWRKGAWMYVGTNGENIQEYPRKSENECSGICWWSFWEYPRISKNLQENQRIYENILEWKFGSKEIRIGCCFWLFGPTPPRFFLTFLDCHPRQNYSSKTNSDWVAHMQSVPKDSSFDRDSRFIWKFGLVFDYMLLAWLAKQHSSFLISSSKTPNNS